MRAIFLLPTLAAFAMPAQAEVVDVQSNGFEVREAAHIAAAPDKVFAALVDVGRWWDSAHSFSGDSAHLSLEPKVGGCFCEALNDGGAAAHMRVVFVAPGKSITLEGALGPLQTTGATGHLGFALKPADGGTDLVLTYDVGGYAKGGWASWAPPVDKVLGQQVARLKAYSEGGKP